ncbi:MAG: hypothetical protein AAB774_01745 [Patescibacteria group bacterium]
MGKTHNDARLGVVELVNLTPHSLVLYQGDSAALTIPPSGELVRCTEEVQAIGWVVTGGISVPLVTKTFGELQS